MLLSAPLLLLALSRPAIAHSGTGLVAQTSNGEVIGHRSAEYPEVLEYLGIPYAAPPVRDLRFEQPRPYQGQPKYVASHHVRLESLISLKLYIWTYLSPLLTDLAGIVSGSRDDRRCLAFNQISSDCPYNAGSTINYPEKAPQFDRVMSAFTSSNDNKHNEDCLTLNVWIRKRHGRTLKPVLVHFHGGRWTSGTTNTPFYHGGHLAFSEDILVVTATYRMNVFGFPGIPGKPSNLGLLDQRKAVEWIRDNIQAFGGDPDRIVLSGQSCGSAVVDYWAYSYRHDPIVAGLISHSGTADSFPANSPELSAQHWQKLTSLLGCTSGDVLRCMKQKNMTAVLAASSKIKPPATGNAGRNQPAFQPTVDNVTVFSDYKSLAGVGKFARLPYLAGHNHNEAGFYKISAWAQGSTLSGSEWQAFNLETFTCPTDDAVMARIRVGVPAWRFRYFADWNNTRLYPDSGAYHGWQLRKKMQRAWATFVADPHHGLEKLGWPQYLLNESTLISLGEGNTPEVKFTDPRVYNAGCWNSTAQVALTAIPGNFKELADLVNYAVHMNLSLRPLDFFLSNYPDDLHGREGMTVNPEISSTATGVLGLLLVALNAAPATFNVVHRLSRRTGSIRLDTSPGVNPGYEDEDGEATELSLQTFSDSWQRVAIAILSVVGLELSLALAVVCLQSGQSYFILPFWLLLGNWALLCLQSVAFFTEASTVERYRLSIYSFWTSSLTVAVPGIEVGLFWSAGYITPGHAQTVLLISQMIAASLRALCSILIPRRPDVYHDGQVVDQEFTGSIYSRLTFSWGNELMKYAAENKSLDIDSLPKLPFAVRAENLYTRLEQTRRSRKLWKALVLENIRPLVWQSVLSLITCVLSFGPQIAMYKILKSLEERSLELRGNQQSWLWVASLGIVIVGLHSIESWLWWIISSQLWVPIHGGLSAVVFAKSMRCKDVKDTRKTPDEEEAQGEKSRQSIINLAAVDSKRVADFATFNYLIPLCIMRLLLATGFLAHLLGWRSLLAGLSVSVVITPLNTFITKKYSTAQQDFMKANDKRTSIVTEILQGIRQIKFASHEQQWEDRIKETRRLELGLLWKTSLYTTALTSLWILGPLMLSAASLTVYALKYGDLPASVAFTALSVFGNLESALAGLPDLISKGMEAKVSSDRIEKYLQSAEKASHTSEVDGISFDSATIAWPTEEEQNPKICDRFILRNLNLQFPQKGLSIIAGRTGAGKSLLLAAILGECDVIQGSIAVPRSPCLEERHDNRATPENWIIDTALAYVAQNSWIENATIRDNILFGLPYNWRRYRKVLAASGLEKDLTILPDADMTDIGAKGVNLSGGQRWRISFARALYSRAGILVMDDIFSALDAGTGRHVYEQGLTGDLAQNRTRILVTHHVGLCLPRTDYCVLLEGGYMTHAGTVEQLRAAQGLTEFLHDLKAEMRDLQDREIARDASRRKHSSVGPPPPPTDSHAPKQFTQDERRATGSIPLKVYMKYMTMGNSRLAWILTCVTYVGFMALLVSRSWWVSVWTSPKSTSPADSTTIRAHTVQQFKSIRVDEDLMFYLGVYLGLSAAACVIGTLRQLALSYASLQSSRQMFHDILAAVLRAPLRWLDTVPLGRILNRFTCDIYTVDWRLSFDLGHFGYKALEVAGIMVAGFLVSPILLLFAGVLLIFCLYLSKSYLTGARELMRLESISKSPVMEQFDSSLAGLTTIRAFDKAEVYIRQMYSRIDRHAQTVWNSWLFNRWLAFRMSLVGAIFSTGAAALVVYVPTIPAAFAGFAISFALQYNYAVSMGVRFYAEMEMDMNATDRVLEYSTIEPEDQGGYQPPAAWPLRGRVEVENLVVGYAPDLPPVLNGLNFSMEPNQRIGVVGRTGAGKSSLTLALFRFLEARQGRIIIDGLDVSQMRLQALRSRLAIIPQDPVLFSGTVRSNLDPFHEYTDLELHNALERVHLLSFEDTITLASQSHRDSSSGSDTLASTPLSPTAGHLKPSSYFTSLSSPISEGGLNLSQGQRQLLCLARAIVAQPKIMILDEATSAVDMETDALIQRSIRSEFGRNDSSLLVIAHRLSTIADFDRILVMDAGKAVEFGPPQELLEIEGGVFRNLVENSGERAVLEDMILGKGN
ncbi:hypothetical protein BDV28DRAFT_145724 [Aspergillus coremiiformis]|uniref:ABC transporter n=1 Tax=Aspergillus coremiiformis TaxID=138285 RepID=A0A5N6ZEG2_9EURO|nr:hypothetical protein BDV28DRAFT_145724 [Aspergillus coremiiformis]